MKGLAFFQRTSSARTWNVASFHSPHSLTWSWCLSFTLFSGGERRVWPLFSPYRDNHGLQWILRVPFVGYCQWHRQRPMWFRDLWQRDRNERHREKYEASLPPASVRIEPPTQSLH